MLRLSHDQPSLWESVLPSELFHMSEELSQVDRLLDDERFFAPFRKRFYTTLGRPTIPVATYLRMMYLKHRYNLGYETLVKEVKDSFTWRRFCHLSLEDSVPDDTTLLKLTHKYGEDTLRSLNNALVGKLKEEKVIRGRKLRMDTTVVEADIHYPTDTSLLADGIRVITRTVVRLKKAGALEITEKIAQQTEEVLGGHLYIPERLVSIFDVEARPIRRGKARADTEFGRKVLLGETDHGIITTYQVLKDNPSDTTLLKSGVGGTGICFARG